VVPPERHGTSLHKGGSLFDERRRQPQESHLRRGEFSRHPLNIAWSQSACGGPRSLPKQLLRSRRSRARDGRAPALDLHCARGCGRLLRRAAIVRRPAPDAAQGDAAYFSAFNFSARLAQRSNGYATLLVPRRPTDGGELALWEQRDVLAR
jgi:hypothetical protein